MNQQVKDIIKEELQHFLNEESLFLHDIKLHEYFEANPSNKNLFEVNIKLHQAYHDDVYGPYVEDIARHIVELDIDERIKQGDLTVVVDLAKIHSKNQDWNLTGFASKYCNFHDMKAFPIFNTRSKDILNNFYGNSSTIDLDNYLEYSKALIEFRKEIGAEKLNFKELDKFAWLHRESIQRKIEAL